LVWHDKVGSRVVGDQNNSCVVGWSRRVPTGAPRTASAQMERAAEVAEVVLGAPVTEDSVWQVRR